MSSPQPSPLADLHLVGLQEVGKKWSWILGLGVLLVVLGMVAIGASMAATLATMIFFGTLMLIGGALQTLHAIALRGWSGFYLDLIAGVLSMVVGFMIVAHPGATAIGLTLLIAVFLILGGIFRIAIGLSVRYQNRLWLILHGVINLMLGFVIWKDWPLSGLWVIGLFIGLDMLFNGWSLIVMALAVKKLTASK
ncbi:MAG: HdeD family acid-resistance protein [Planctomycetia bacterium]|nr:HdeD family acid-resistance protein [Planctomycetia bacterium]